MNYFYDLPDDLIDMIYKEVHKKKQNVINICIGDIGYGKEYWKEVYEDQFNELLMYNPDAVYSPPNECKCLFQALDDWNNMYKSFNSYDMKMYFDY